MSDEPAADWNAFWQPGPLPTPEPDPEPPEGWLAQVGRPEITVDGRNLADVLSPAYRALTSPPP